MRIRTLSQAVLRPTVALACLLLAACTSSRKEKQISTTISPEQQSAFTQTAETAILSHGFTSSDRHATMRVLNITEKLNSAAGKTYVARVVQAQPVQLAMPVPADRVIVTDNLVAVAKTDDMLAAAVAHQMGHLAAGHPMQKLKSADMGNGRTGQLVLANWQPNGGDAAHLLEVQQLAARLWEMKYSPEEERQAEDYASGLLAKARYKAGSHEALASALAADGAKKQRTPEYLTMHPQK